MLGTSASDKMFKICIGKFILFLPCVHFSVFPLPYFNYNYVIKLQITVIVVVIKVQITVIVIIIDTMNTT